MAADHELSAGDSLLRIEINPSLPCGIGVCGQPARHARIERDPRYAALWRLLPICDVHLRSLDAAGRAVATAGASLTMGQAVASSPTE
jgi:hypothetical protein